MKKSLGSRTYRTDAVTVLVLCFTLIITCGAAQAQTLTVLHTFTGQRTTDGAHPMDGVIFDRAGNLYGVAFEGGLNGNPEQVCFTINDNGGCGTVFKLAKHGSSFVYTTLYSFQGPPDGNYPAGVVIGPDGTLYGATSGGGIVNNGSCQELENGCGTAFQVRPPPTFCSNALCPWNEVQLYAFTGLNGDAGGPSNGDLLFNGQNIFGTTTFGGAHSQGAVYELTHSGSGWTESIAYSFNPSVDNLGNPNSGLLMDQAGNFYGSSGYSISGGGTNGGVYELAPGQSGFTATALQTFECIGGLNGCYPVAPIFDPAGDLITPMDSSGFYGDGTVIELSATQNWSIDLLYTFQHHQGGPAGRLAMDSAGNLYGVGSNCENGYGCIYKLTPSENGYTYTDLYEFTGHGDGWQPSGPVAIDANGNLYGTTIYGGNLDRCLGEGIQGCGTVWEFTP